MLFSNVVFPLFTISFAAPAVSAMHLNPAHAKRAALANRDLGSFKLVRSEDALIAGRNKGKRLVRKKKRSTCQAKVNVTSSSIDSGTSPIETASATFSTMAYASTSEPASNLSTYTSSESESATETASAIATNAIGNIENWAGGSASASSSSVETTFTSSASPAAQTAASSSGWSLVEEWVSAIISSHQLQLKWSLSLVIPSLITGTSGTTQILLTVPSITYLLLTHGTRVSSLSTPLATLS